MTDETPVRTCKAARTKNSGSSDNPPPPLLRKRKMIRQTTTHDGSATDRQLPIRHASSPLVGTVLLLIGLTSCTGSPATLSRRPDFEVTTIAGIASVSIRESPAAMTDAEFTRFVKQGMEQAAPGSLVDRRVDPRFPPLRIVWYVNSTASRGSSQLVVNVSNGAGAFAYEESTLSNTAPPVAVTSKVAWMVHRLLADIAARVRRSNRPVRSSHL